MSKNRMICNATRRAFVAAENGERELKLRLGLHVFYIYHFLVRPKFKFLIAPEIVAFRGGSVEEL